MSLVESIKKVALVTGSSRGLGSQIALELSLRNFKVILADKLDQTSLREKIINESGNDDIHSYLLNLASFNSVRKFAKQMHEEIGSLDVLINNAGVFCMKKQKTVDGLDAVMQINHLSPFLLTNLMNDLLKRSLDGRIIFITSNGSFFHRFTVDQLRKPDYFTPHFISGAVHYYNTKLCNMISSKYFADKLKKYNISSNTIHPYMMNTKFLINNQSKNIVSKVEATVWNSISKYMTRDVKYCANGVIFLANSEKIRQVTGKYFINNQIYRVPRILEDNYICKKVCEETSTLVGL